MADPGTNFRRAYQAVLDRTPPAPAWDEIDAPPAPVRRPVRRRRAVPPWVMAGAAAALLVLVLVGAATLGLDGGPATTGSVPPPAAEAPPATESPPTTVSDFIAVDPPAVQLAPRLVAASSELSDDFAARYLVDGTERAWNDDSLGGEGAVLTFTFAGPVDLQEIVLRNLADPERFARNHRVAEFELRVDGEAVLVATVPDEPGPHPYEVGRAGTEVAIVVLATYPAEAVAGAPPFEELAVAEVEFIGPS